MRTIKTALAGFGSGGRIYNAPIISSVPGFHITKIMTSNPANIKAAGKAYPEAVIVPDYYEIIEDPNIELIVVLLPNHLHYDYAKKALTAGKHVIVEKPITPTVRQAEELIDLARKNNLLLSVNHNRRWDSDFRTIRKIKKTKELGDIVEYEAHFDRFRNEIKVGWKENPDLEGSGILYDLGSHLIDQAMVLFGHPTEIFADIRIQRNKARVPDHFELILFYPGLKVTLKAGMLVKVKGPTYSVHGTRGSYVKYGVDVQEEALKQGKKPGPNWGKEPESIWGRIDTLERKAKLQSISGDYREFYKNIYGVLTGSQAALDVTPEQARDVIRVIELAQESHEKRCVVEFKETPVSP